MPRALTKKQQSFCLACVEMSNASDAYRHAYNAKNMKPTTINRNAKTLMDDSKIAARIEEIREEVTAKAKKKLAINKEWVLEQLVENVAMAKAADPVLDHEGKPTGEYRTNLQAANKSLELIGKELSMFIDRKEIRTGQLDDVSHEDKQQGLDAVREEIKRRRESSHPVH